MVYKTGMVIRICDIPESVKNHKPIKDLLQAHCEVDYVEFKGGDKEVNFSFTFSIEKCFRQLLINF